MLPNTINDGHATIAPTVSIGLPSKRPSGNMRAKETRAKQVIGIATMDVRRALFWTFDLDQLSRARGRKFWPAEVRVSWWAE